MSDPDVWLATLYSILFRQYTLFEAPRASNGIKNKKSIRGLTAKKRGNDALSRVRALQLEEDKMKK